MSTVATAPPEDPTLPEGARPDEFFTADQIRRLFHLTTKRRQALDRGGELPEDELRELDELIKESVLSTIPRALKMRAEGKL